jgi:hypothetical protein
MKCNVISPEYLKSILNYDLETGFFTWLWRKDISNCVNMREVGKVAGSICPTTKYRRIKINGKLYKCSRLAWIYVYNKNPNFMIDHINGDRSDDRISNLREATRSQNGANRSKQKRNKWGNKGITVRPNGKYQAEIRANGKRYYLGVYETADDAGIAYANASKKYFGEYAKF